MGSQGNNPGARARILTGIYTGNGADDRNINIGVDLASKNNPYVIIKGTHAVAGVQKIEYGAGEVTMYFDSTADAATDRIQSFTSTGFQVGTNNGVNQNSYVYRYIAFWDEL